MTVSTDDLNSRKCEMIHLCLIVHHDLFDNYYKYISLVESIPSHGIIGWSGVNDCFLIGVHFLQNLILKIVYQKKLFYLTNLLYNESQINDHRAIRNKEETIYIRL